MELSSFLGTQSLSPKQPPSSFDAFIFSAAAQRHVTAPAFVDITANSRVEAKQKRKRPKACERCKRFKLKCDAGRPCKNCTAKGCGDQCAEHVVAEEAAIVEAAKQVKNAMYMMMKPIGFEGRMIELPRETNEALPQTKNEYLMRLIGGGILIQMKTAQDVVESLPPDITDSLIAGIEALQLVHTGHSTVQSLKEYRGRSRPVIHNKHNRGRIIRILDDNHSEHACFREVGHIRDVTYPPTFAFNRKCAELMGIDPDELLARIARSDLDLPCPEIEFLACMVESISSITTGGRHAYTRWQRGYWAGRSQASALFIQLKSDIRIDGEETIQETTIFPISPEEYEHARISSPARCRPILNAMGDNRTASDLLRDVDRDNRQTVRSLRKTPDGRRQLQAMASEIKYRFAPIISAASALPRHNHHQPPAPSPAPSQPDSEPGALPSPSWVSSTASPATPGAFVESPSAEAAWGSTEALQPCASSSASSSSSDLSSHLTEVTVKGGPGEQLEDALADDCQWVNLKAEAQDANLIVASGPEDATGGEWRGLEEGFGSLTEEEAPAMGREDSAWMEGFVFNADVAVKTEGGGWGSARVVRIDDEEEEEGGQMEASWARLEGAGEGAMFFEGTQGNGAAWDGGVDGWWAGGGGDLTQREIGAFDATREAWGGFSAEPMGA